MPIKLFEDGEILDAADVNTYFMDQALVIFDDSAERDAAFGGTVNGIPNEPLLTEGRICYLKSDDTIYIYTGAAWTAQLATIATGAVTSDKIFNDTIMNVDINSAAGIVDTKLATIATAGKVSNSATTATNANTASAIVARDASGNFTAGVINAVTNVGAGRGVGIQADPTNTSAILQFTNNAASSQLSSLVATSNLITVTSPLAATSFAGPLTGNVTGNLTGNAATATTASTVSPTSITESSIDYTTVPKQTVSTSSPSGGKQHDIWIKV